VLRTHVLAIWSWGLGTWRTQGLSFLAPLLPLFFRFVVLNDTSIDLLQSGLLTNRTHTLVKKTPGKPPTPPSAASALGPSQSLSLPPFTAPAVLYKGKRGRKRKRTTKEAESKARGLMGLRLNPILRILGVWRQRGQLSYVHREWRQGGFIVAFAPNFAM